MGRNGFHLTLSSHSLSLREVRQGLNQGPEAEAMEGCRLLACSLAHAQPVFLRGHLPRGWCLPQWAEFSHSKNHVPQTCPSQCPPLRWLQAVPG